MRPLRILFYVFTLLTLLAFGGFCYAAVRPTVCPAGVDICDRRGLGLFLLLVVLFASGAVGVAANEQR
jgi:hypothetical protein